LLSKSSLRPRLLDTYFPASKYCIAPLALTIDAVVASGFHTIAELGFPIYRSKYFK
jgi:hypothetical protein